MDELNVFIITPIGGTGSPQRRRADDLLSTVIRPAIDVYNESHPTEPALVPLRADKRPDPGLITMSVVEDIVNSPFVIVDLAGHNPNVFYELGIADAFRIPTIRIKRPDERLPFDSQEHRCIDLPDYEGGLLGASDAARASGALLDQINAVRTAGFDLTSVVTLAGQRAELRERTAELSRSEDPNSQALAALAIAVEELTREVADVKTSAHDVRDLTMALELAGKAIPIHEVSDPYPRVQERVRRELSRLKLYDDAGSSDLNWMRDWVENRLESIPLPQRVSQSMVDEVALQLVNEARTALEVSRPK